MPTLQPFTFYRAFAAALFSTRGHDLIGVGGVDADTLAICLTARVPDVAADAVRGDIGEIAAGGGYTSGGKILATTGTLAGTTLTVTAPDPDPWVSDGTFANFHWAVLVNRTTENLIGYWPHEGRGMSTQNGSTSGVEFVNGVVLVSSAVYP